MEDTTMKRWQMTLSGLLMTALMLTASAQHDHEGDIHLGVAEGAAAVVEPEELAEPPYTIRYSLEDLLPGVYGVDVGWDFNFEMGSSTPQLRQVTIQQVFISPNLVGVIEGETDPIFGEGLPGTWTLVFDPNDPEAVHQHIIFATTTLPTGDDPLRFVFRLVNAVAWDGSLLQDSVDYTLEFVPEPASLLALSAGLAGLAAVRRRKEVIA
jgi:hypothetical protein